MSIWPMLGAFSLGAVCASLAIAIFYVPDRILWFQRAGIAALLFIATFIGWRLSQ